MFFSSLYRKVFKKEKQNIKEEICGNPTEFTVKDTRELYNTPADIQNAYSSAAQLKSSLYNCQNASNSTSNVSRSISNSYTDAVKAATQSSNGVSQHMTDSKLEGSLIGIMEIEVLHHHICEMPNGKYAMFPFKDTIYEYFVELPAAFGRKDYYRFRPYVIERLNNNYEEKCKEIGYYSCLSMQKIDTADELPSEDEFSLVPIDPIPFKISNMRHSLNDNVYRFFLYDIEVAFLVDDENDAYCNTNLSHVLHLFDETGIVKDEYSKEEEHQMHKIAKKFGTEASILPEIHNGICVSDCTDGDIRYFEVKQKRSAGNAIFIASNAQLHKNLIVSKPASTPIREDNFKNQTVELLKGISMDGKTLYHTLFVGGDIYDFSSHNKI